MPTGSAQETENGRTGQTDGESKISPQDLADILTAAQELIDAVHLHVEKACSSEAEE